MSFKYTLTLMTNGEQVFKRWSGDRDEVRRMAAAAVVDLDAHPQLAESFIGSLTDANLKAMVQDETWGFALNSKDLTSTLHLEVHKKG
jgi:hypothetical protein